MHAIRIVEWFTVRLSRVGNIHDWEIVNNACLTVGRNFGYRIKIDE